MQIRVLAFARVRELLGDGELTFDLPEGATIGDVWQAAVDRNGALGALAESTRIARNGRIVNDSLESVREKDEIALLPPVGGG
ncbi:MAG TPA: MoaD/ThiS family protein [Candidatus Baltobacteraceae bacterium]|jgi:molybdopterin converting factor small subunit